MEKWEEWTKISNTLSQFNTSNRICHWKRPDKKKEFSIPLPHFLWYIFSYINHFYMKKVHSTALILYYGKGTLSLLSFGTWDRGFPKGDAEMCVCMCIFKLLRLWKCYDYIQNFFLHKHILFVIFFNISQFKSFFGSTIEKHP